MTSKRVRIAAVAVLLTACSANGSTGVAITGTRAPRATTTVPATTTTTTTTTTTIADVPKIVVASVPKATAEPGVVAVRTPTGVLGLQLGVEAGGIRIRTPCSREAVVSRAEVVGPIDVVLDPGHGGLEPGAESGTGLTEAELNLDIALRTRDLLEARGFSVAMTRDGDWFRTIADRAELADAIRPRAFVSIHHNSGVDAPRRNGPGSEVYHERDEPESQRLGGLVWEEVVGALSAFDIRWTSADRGVRWRADRDGDDFYGVLRRANNVPAVILEGAYMSAAAEAQLMTTDEFRAVEAGGIARGIERWLSTDDPGSGYIKGFTAGGVARLPNMSKCRDPRLE